MLSGPLTRRLSTLGGIAALAVIAGTAPATADTDLDVWPIAAVGDEANSNLLDVVAIGPRNAWAFGESRSSEGPDPLAVRWNGRSWTTVTMPTGLGKGISFADASSPRNVWAFGGGDPAFGDAYALRWDGKAWSVAHHWPSYTWLTDAEVLGPRDVWVFGFHPNDLDHKSWRYDGRRWAEVPTPVGSLKEASAVAADDIWAVGRHPEGRAHDLLARWDGRTWTEVDVPGLPHEGDHMVFFDRVHAVSSREVWVFGREYRQDGDKDTYGFLLLHFDGDGWQKIDPPPAPRMYGVYDVASDGEGGVWVLPSIGDTPELLHYRNGQWAVSQVDLPGGPNGTVRAIAGVPHRRSAWAVGSTPVLSGTWNWTIWSNGISPRQPKP